MSPFIAGLVGIGIGGWLTSELAHRAWLREHRLDEYVNLLTTFPTAAAKFSAALGSGG